MLLRAVLLLAIFCLLPIRATEVLEIAAEDDAGNWSMKDGTGFANDLVKAAFKAVGVEVKLTVMPYMRCKRLTEEGECAACFSVSKLPELEKLFLFPHEPLFVCHAEFFQSVEHTFDVKNLEKLPRGTVVGVVTGYEYPEQLYKLREQGILVFEETNSEELNLKKLADGRIQLALINYNETKPVELMLNQAGTGGRVKPLLRCGELASWLAFSRKHPRSNWAREQFNAGFKLIQKDGTLEKIQAQWNATAAAQVEAAKAKK